MLAVSILVAVVAALVVSLRMLVREKEALRLAREETAISTQVSGFLKETLEAAGPYAAMGMDTTLLRDVLAKTATRLNERKDLEPRIEAEMRLVIGNVYNDLRMFDEALLQLARALEISRTLHPGDHPDLASALIDYAAGLEMAGKVQEAAQPAEEALEMWRRLQGSESIQAASAETLVAWIWTLQGQIDRAEPLARHAMELWRHHPEEESLSEAPNTLVAIYDRSKQPAQSLAVHGEEVQVLRRIHGNHHPLLATALDNYGIQLLRMGRLEEAENTLLEALQIGREFFGDRNPDEDHILSGLASIAGRRGDREKQLDYARQALVSGARVYPEGHRYRRASEATCHRVLPQHVEQHLTEALSGIKPDALQTARIRLKELQETPELARLNRVEEPWIQFLSSILEAAPHPPGPSRISPTLPPGNSLSQARLKTAEHLLQMLAR